MKEPLLDALIDLAEKLEKENSELLTESDIDNGIKTAMNITILSILNDLHKLIIKFK